MRRETRDVSVMVKLSGFMIPIIVAVIAALVLFVRQSTTRIIVRDWDQSPLHQAAMLNNGADTIS